LAGSSTLEALEQQSLPSTSRRRWYLQALRDPSFLIGLVILLALGAVGALAPRIAPYDPPRTSDGVYFLNLLAPVHAPPFWAAPDEVDLQQVSIDNPPPTPYDPRFPLGTDSERRDMLSLLVYGTRYSLAIGLLAVLLIWAVGVALGVLAGWRRGKLENLVLWLADTAESIPSFLACALFAAVVSEWVGRLLADLGLYMEAIPVVALSLACVGWASVARLVRVQVIATSGSEWVEAARALGVPSRRLILRHVLPFVLGPALVVASAQLPTILIIDGLLGAVGIGPRPPSITLGHMIFQEFPSTVAAPIFILMPTAILIAISLAATALANGVQRLLSPERR